jgi:hypothetical protein
MRWAALASTNLKGTTGLDGSRDTMATRRPDLPSEERVVGSPHTMNKPASSICLETQATSYSGVSASWIRMTS